MTLSSAPVGELPQSDALAEALPESLNFLFSKDPENYSAQDISRIVEDIRKQRERFAAAEAAGKPARGAGKKIAPAATSLLPADLGL